MLADRQTISRFFLTLALAVAMAFALTSPAMAEGSERTEALVITAESPSEDKLDAEGWAWDASTLTLTLNGANFNVINANAITLPEGATVDVAGDSTVKTSADVLNAASIVASIKGEESLNVKGAGKLILIGKKGYSKGIDSEKDLTITGATIEANVQSDALSSTGTLTIEKSKIDATGSIGVYGSKINASESVLNCTSIRYYGLRCESATITNCTVNITSPFVGVLSNNNIEIADSDFNVQGSQIGLHILGTIAIHGGTTKATSGSHAIVGDKILLDGEAQLTVSGYGYGLYAQGSDEGDFTDAIKMEAGSTMESTCKSVALAVDYSAHPDLSDEEKAASVNLPADSLPEGYAMKQVEGVTLLVLAPKNSNVTMGEDDFPTGEGVGGPITIEYHEPPMPEITFSVLTFDTNGGEAMDSVRKVSGARVDLTDYVPVREGYTFLGWYLDADLSEAVSNVKLTKNITVYAAWEENIPSTVVLPFSDVNEGDWFYAPVAYVYENGLMNGTSATTFAPNEATSRGMLVTMLWRLEGQPAAQKASFSDISVDDYYATAVAWANENGIVTGVDEAIFAPKSAITREQFAAIMYRYAQYKGMDTSAHADLSSYTDNTSISAYAREALSWANATGLINGMSTTELAPQAQATRAQTVAILWRWCEDVRK